ncbi:MAG: acyl carrier protein [Clostridia bacterium]
MEEKEELLAILQEFAPGVDFATNTRLVDDKIITSLNLIKLIVKLNGAFDIHISAAHLVPENFNSADAIFALVQRLE